MDSAISSCTSVRSPIFNLHDSLLLLSDKHFNGFILRRYFPVASCAMRRCTAGTLGVWANTPATKLRNYVDWRWNRRRKKGWETRNWDLIAANGLRASSGLYLSHGATLSPRSEKIGFSSLCSVSSWLYLATLWITASVCATQVGYRQQVFFQQWRN